VDRRWQFLAGAENAYRNDFAALWQPAGDWLGLLIIGLIAGRARRFAQFTVPDLLEARFNSVTQVLATITIVISYTVITSYQFISIHLRPGGLLVCLYDLRCGPHASNYGRFLWRRTTTAGAVASIFLGTFVTVGWKLLQQLGASAVQSVVGEIDPIVPALVASGVSLIAISLVTEPTRRAEDLLQTDTLLH
jgi:Na+/proline symporter